LVGFDFDVQILIELGAGFRLAFLVLVSSLYGLASPVSGTLCYSKQLTGANI